MLAHDADERAAVQQKACPIVIRERDNTLEILAFRHPLAGCQLVKGTIEPGETSQQAAVRELFEESGITGRALRDVASLRMNDPPQIWHLVLCATPSLPDGWRHRTSDGGGLDFVFFWTGLQEASGRSPRTADETWHPNYLSALDFLRRHLSAPNNA
ncbi:NUDIX hydrolase [Bradyrhizobium sp. HKCCYLS3077]|uniref:NUDIX hydrolase n=1 Tax=Bradyrhizobium sp. HKCCYLS3077 TaxID=3420761 RepID=UPI003EBD7849